jgi:cation diffusion facilitator CzcD-associated flavoprotein CzcO
MNEPTLSMSPEEIRERYRQEREKRLRSDGVAQYRELKGVYEDFDKDPYVEPGFTRDAIVEETEVAIIGAGLAGMMTAGKLVQKGVRNIRIIDKAGDFGGTWYWNRYPGCACDVESYVYIPFLEETGYMPVEKYSKAPEIFEHCQRIGRHFDLYPMALFQTEAEDARWDDEAQRWLVTTNRGDRLMARFIVIAGGILHKAKLPGIPGLETFKGKSFHTSRWDYGYTGGSPTEAPTKLGDKTVAIVGTGATAVQIVPQLAACAKQVYVCQRTPAGVGVRGNQPTDWTWAKSLKPGWQLERMENFTAVCSGLPFAEDMVGDGWTEIYRGALAKGGEDKAALPPEQRQLADFEIMDGLRARVSEIVKDPETAEALKPWYDVWCKRPCFHDEYLQAFNRPNVKLLDTEGMGVNAVTERGVVVKGVEYPVDCIMFASGFEVGNLYARRMGFEIYGRGGVSLTEDWEGGANAHTLHGLLSRGFPNAFLFNGAQGGQSTSFVHTLYDHAVHASEIIAAAKDRGATVVEPTPEAEEAWWNVIIGTLPQAYDQMKECTPSWINGEGQRDARMMKLAAYMGSLISYSEIVRDWRERGMPGLEMK